MAIYNYGVKDGRFGEGFVVTTVGMEREADLGDVREKLLGVERELKGLYFEREGVVRGLGLCEGLLVPGGNPGRNLTDGERGREG